MIPREGDAVEINCPWDKTEKGTVTGGRYFDQDQKHYINIKLDNGIQIINASPDDLVVF